MARSPRNLDDLRRTLLQSPEGKLDYERAYVRVSVSNFLQALRAEARLTQIEVAALAGMTQSEISRLERADGPRAPELATLVRFARACGFDLTLVGTPRRPRKRRTRQTAPLTPGDA